MDAIIKTRGISKIYGQVHALNNVSLEVPRGATGLLGPNGAGKSTLIRNLIGLVNPTSGTGSIFGKDILTEGFAIRQRIGYMPEHECLIKEMVAVNMVAYAGQLAGMPRTDAIQRAHEVLHFVGIGDERYRTIDTYSTGMKQKVNLAQALVHDPELLFLDEPTNGLDPRGREEMLALIKFLAQEQGKSIVLSSHILADVEQVCENILVLADGELLIQGRLEDLVKGVEGVVNVRVSGERMAFARALKEMGYQAEDQDAVMFKVQAPDVSFSEERIFQDIMKAASEPGVQLRYASRTAMNLEDLFISLVEEKGKGGAA